MRAARWSLAKVLPQMRPFFSYATSGRALGAAVITLSVLVAPVVDSHAHLRAQGVIDTALAAPPVRQRTGAEPASESATWIVAAKNAMLYTNSQYNASTGLFNSVRNYAYGTMWDIASGLAVLYCADALDLIDGDVYDRRMRRALKTISELALYKDVAFNKNYHTDTGKPAGRTDGERARMYGWSALDIGRLLVWLRIIDTTQPQYHGDIATIVGRLNMNRLVIDGQLFGEDISPSTGNERTHQEGRVGYEQYAAHGFELWGQKPYKALDYLPTTTEVDVWGITLRKDWRGDSHLTSEPFVLLGLELGWTPPERELAWRVLAVQRERWKRTNKVTMVSEDAMGEDPPSYFYYYSVLTGSEPFSVSAVGGTRTLERPRWISAKAAFGWHALLPSDYTMLAVRTVLPAMGAAGWGSGVYEGTQRSTGSENINTAAGILEAALYNKLGRPLMYNR
jgi:hypothetical protein